MTYCVGMLVRQGLVALSDGRLTSGSQLSVARKNILMGTGPASRFFLMNSGLRSLRDKTLAYLRQSGFQPPTMLAAVTAYCKALRRVMEEDREALEAANFKFNLHALIGGQLAEDEHPALFLVYPEGNWIAADERTPFLAIGTTSYGKAILDRVLVSETHLETAAKLAYLSFDNTRLGTADVGFPVDLLTYRRAIRQWEEFHFNHDDLALQHHWWNQHLAKLAEALPDLPGQRELERVASC